MTEIILHLGFSKTGTTFLQKKIFNNLEDINYLYHPYNILEMCIEENRTNLLSGERFSVSHPHFVDFCDRYVVLDYLHKLFPEARIIIGFREESSWLKSCYNQYVKAQGGDITFEEYLQKFEHNIPDQKKYLEELKKRWDDICVYHQETLNEEIPKICDFIGRPVPKYDDKKINKSVGRFTLFASRLLNKIFGEFITKNIRYVFKWLRGERE